MVQDFWRSVYLVAFRNLFSRFDITLRLISIKRFLDAPLLENCATYIKTLLKLNQLDTVPFLVLYFKRRALPLERNPLKTHVLLLIGYDFKFCYTIFKSVVADIF